MRPKDTKAQNGEEEGFIISTKSFHRGTPQLPKEGARALLLLRRLRQRALLRCLLGALGQALREGLEPRA
jgi:hypothetical protein